MKIDPNHRLLECFSCSDTYSSTGDPKTQWAYSVRLTFEDYHGDRIEGLIEGSDATDFFSGLSPINLLSNTEARQRVGNCLKALLDRKSIIDVCVKPYIQPGRGGVSRIACKVFGTELLLE